MTSKLFMVFRRVREKKTVLQILSTCKSFVDARTYEDGMQKEMQVSTPFHFNSMVHYQVGEQDHSNVTPARRSEHKRKTQTVMNELVYYECVQKSCKELFKKKKIKKKN